MQIKWVREPQILAIIAAGTAALFLLLAVSTAASTTAQTTASAINTTTPTTTTTVTNFTQLLSQGKEFTNCETGACIPYIDVLYQSPTTLVLKSGYIDLIWKAVDLAKKEGYKVDGISTYLITSSEATNLLPQTNTVNVLARCRF